MIIYFSPLNGVCRFLYLCDCTTFFILPSLLYLFQTMDGTNKENNLQWLKRQSTILQNIYKISRNTVNKDDCESLFLILSEKDLSYLPLLISTLDKYLAPAFFLWHKYQQPIGDTVSKIMNTLYSKIFYGKLEHLKTSFDRLKEKYQRATRKKVVLLKEGTIKMHASDTKLKSYIIQCQKTKKDENNQKRTMLVHEDNDQQTPLFVQPLNYFGNNYLETRISVLKDMYYKVKLGNEKPEKLEEEAKLSQKIQQRPLLSRECFSCLQLFYEDQDLTSPMNQQPVTFFGKIVNIGSMHKEILQQIVSYLNGKGGVILIGTQKVGNKVVPLVEELSEFKKQQQQDRIQTSLSYIYPPVSVSKQIDLKFIPIADNPRKHLDTTKPVWKDNGACILRITVLALEPHQTYYYNVFSSPANPQNLPLEPFSQPSLQQGQTPAFHVFSRHTEAGGEELKNEAIYEFMKTRYRQFNPASRTPDFVLRERGNYYPSMIEHTYPCRQVEKGKPYFGNQEFYKSSYKKKENEVKSSNPFLAGVENFKNISLIVVNGSLLDKIRNIFTSEEKLQCKILKAFPNENFKLSNNTFLVFHNCKFQKLKNGLNKSKSQLRLFNEKKDIILISTLPNVAFSEELIRKNSKQIQQKVMDITMQKIDIKYIQTVAYIKCVSNITAIYIYFYMHQYHNIKGKFEKIPTGSAAKSKILKNNLGNNKGKKEKQKEKDERNIHDQEMQPFSENQDDYYHQEYQEIEDSYRRQRRYYGSKKQQVAKSQIRQYNPQPEIINHSPQTDNPTFYDSYQNLSPTLVYRCYDSYLNRYDYYSDQIIYMFYPNGSQAGTSPYSLQQLASSVGTSSLYPPYNHLQF